MAKSNIEKIRIPLSRAVVLILFVLILFSRGKLASTPIAQAVFLALSFFFSGLACAGRAWCSLYIAGYKNKVLIEQGPYSCTRNPLYFFTSLGILGTGLSTLTFTIPALMLLGFTLYYPLVIRDEEKRLMARHPEKFPLYKEKVPAFFPRLHLLHEPKTYIVQPRIFRRHLVSAFCFVSGTALIAFLSLLKIHAILPSIFSLY